MAAFPPPAVGGSRAPVMAAFPPPALGEPTGA
jgi:hypothetical protein